MRNKLEKAIRLAKKTGDRLIIFDDIRSDDPVVVMSFDEYERIMEIDEDFSDLTDDDPLDRINPDITDWQDDLEPVIPNEDNVFFGEGEVPAPEDGEAGTLAPKKRWSIPETRKTAAEEVIEEDRQYLEEVRF